MNAVRILLISTLTLCAAFGQAQDAAALRKELDTKGRASLYGMDSEIVTEAKLQVLLPVLQLLEDKPELKLRIEAHTAKDGTAAGSRAILQRRLHIVSVWLIQHGIDGNRFTTMAVGDTRPLADNATAEGRVINRRIDLVKQ